MHFRLGLKKSKDKQWVQMEQGETVACLVDGVEFGESGPPPYSISSRELIFRSIFLDVSMS